MHVKITFLPFPHLSISLTARKGKERLQERLNPRFLWWIRGLRAFAPFATASLRRSRASTAAKRYMRRGEMCFWTHSRSVACDGVYFRRPPLRDHRCRWQRHVAGSLRPSAASGRPLWNLLCGFSRQCWFGNRDLSCEFLVESRGVNLHILSNQFKPQIRIPTPASNPCTSMFSATQPGKLRCACQCMLMSWRILGLCSKQASELVHGLLKIRGEIKKSDTVAPLRLATAIILRGSKCSPFHANDRWFTRSSACSVAAFLLCPSHLGAAEVAPHCCTSSLKLGWPPKRSRT